MSTGNSDDQAPRSVPYDRDRHDVSGDATRRHDVAADRDGDGVADLREHADRRDRTGDGVADDRDRRYARAEQTDGLRHDREAVVARERERFGGVKLGSAFFGWLTATGAVAFAQVGAHSAVVDSVAVAVVRVDVL